MREILLGLIQGFTEFLPISSSGHLVIGQRLLPGANDIEADVLLDILLHFSTLFVVVLYYRQEILGIFKAAIAPVRRTKHQLASVACGLDGPVLRKMPFLILVGTIPTGILGILIKFSDHIETFFSSLTLVGLALVATGIALYLADTKLSATPAKTELSYLDAFIIGTVQGIAILPGISRSGSTISTSILRGIERKTAATFSFLLSIPAILGVVILEGKNVLALTHSPHLLSYALGMSAAFISGYIAIVALIRVVVKQRLRWFSAYCWIVGGSVLLYSLLT